MALSAVFQREVCRSPLFSGFDSSAFNKLFASAELIRMRQHELLFSCGDPAGHFYLVRTGSVRLFLLAADGAEKTYSILQPSHHFAECSMFTQDSHHQVNCQLLEDSEIFAFNSRCYMDLLQHYPQTLFWIVTDLSRQLEHRTMEIADLSVCSATDRLLKYLLSFIPDDHNETIFVRLPTQKSTIASHLSIQRETLSRILCKLKQQQLIEVRGNDIRILSPQKIRGVLHART